MKIDSRGSTEPCLSNTDVRVVLGGIKDLLTVFCAIEEMKELELCFKSANSVPVGRVILQDKRRALINAGVAVLNRPSPNAGEYFYPHACYIDLDDFMRVKRGFNSFGILENEGILV